MGISKKALEELAKSKETSVEALRPLKEMLVQIAVSKDFNKLKSVSAEAVTNSVVTSSTYTTLDILLQSGVLRNASAAKLRSFSAELNNCFSPTSNGSLPDRVIRDLIAENWKEHKELFPLEGTVVTYGGSRVQRLNTAFSMLVENSPQTRRYLRYCQKVLPPNVGVMYSLVPVSTSSFKRLLVSHTFNPSHSRSNSSLANCANFWRFTDKQLDYMFGVFFQEVNFVLRNWSTMTSLRSFYHAHHCLSTTLEIARQRSMQSMVTGNFPGRQINNDYTANLTARHDKFLELMGGITHVESAKAPMSKLLINLSADCATYLMPNFMELWANFTKNPRTAIEKSAVDSSEFVTQLLKPATFLMVTVEYIPQRVYVDNRAVTRSVTTDDLRYSGFKTFEEVYNFVGVKLGQVITKSLLRTALTQAESTTLVNFRDEVSGPIEAQPTTHGDSGVKGSIGKGIVSPPARVALAVAQISTIFDTLQRRNVWTTLLKHQLNPSL